MGTWISSIRSSLSKAKRPSPTGWWKNYLPSSLFPKERSSLPCMRLGKNWQPAARICAARARKPSGI